MIIIKLSADNSFIALKDSYSVQFGMQRITLNIKLNGGIKIAL